jgi:murein DD-endopeptidase MepM/ murein hydrolase activator NlpD
MALEPTRTRRQLIGSAAGILGASVLGLGAAHALGEPLSVTGPATALKPARRLRPSAELLFPVDIAGGLNVLNNFSGFSRANGSCGHAGIDIGTPTLEEGRELYACIDGFILDIQQYPNDQNQFPARGNAVLLESAVGDVYRYHHLSAFVDGMVEGDRLQRGDLIGYMGSTGNTGWPHLHFEVRRGGKIGTAVDPVPLLPFPLPGVQLGPSTAC